MQTFQINVIPRPIEWIVVLACWISCDLMVASDDNFVRMIQSGQPFVELCDLVWSACASEVSCVDQDVTSRDREGHPVVLGVGITDKHQADLNLFKRN